jgi:hypothetical protein
MTYYMVTGGVTGNGDQDATPRKITDMLLSFTQGTSAVAPLPTIPSSEWMHATAGGVRIESGSQSFQARVMDLEGRAVSSTRLDAYSSKTIAMDPGTYVVQQVTPQGNQVRHIQILR